MKELKDFNESSVETGRSDSTSTLRRRHFLHIAGTIGISSLAAKNAMSSMRMNKSRVIDSHMHVWANDPQRYPFAHPYQADFKNAPCQATVEILINDMNRHGCTHAVLVQVIYHGWDNSYVANCVKRFPKRLKAQGLIDPTDPKVADKLEFWMKEHGLHGMRFSPMYYQNGNLGGDGWIHADETHLLWKKAERLGAVLNFFIAPTQLNKLSTMVQAHPNVKVVIDHLSQMDLGKDPESQMRMLLSMAKFSNVWVKISELTSVSASGVYPFVDSFRFIKRVYEAFGPDRLLFGTGYPGDARAFYQRPTLKQEIDLVRTKIPCFSAADRQKILGENAAQLWGFDT